MLGVRRVAVLDAPSNLGLRPPTATSVPGCAKAPGALRDHGLVARLGARDAGCITPARYDPAGWQPGDGVAQSEDIAAFTKRLADRLGSILAADEFPLVLGGDCSILLGAGLAMRRHESRAGGRIGLVYVDGHSDFRHQGNASYVGAAAGEALALATGRGQPNLAAIEHRRPYFRDVDVVLLGIRTHDEYRLDLQAAGIVSRPVPELRSDGAARSAQWARTQLTDCAAFWVHVDVDVLDPAVMPAVDAPDVGGIAYTELELLLQNLVSTRKCLGVQVTVFDPDYDPDAVYARELTDTLVAGLSPLTQALPSASDNPPATVAALPIPDISDVPDRASSPAHSTEPAPTPPAPEMAKRDATAPSPAPLNPQSPDAPAPNPSAPDAASPDAPGSDPSVPVPPSRDAAGSDPVAPAAASPNAAGLDPSVPVPPSPDAASPDAAGFDEAGVAAPAAASVAGAEPGVPGRAPDEAGPESNRDGGRTQGAGVEPDRPAESAVVPAARTPLDRRLDDAVPGL